MLDQAGIQKAIINRLDAIDSSCNSWHIQHNEGVIRGLLWALTGKDPETVSVSGLLTTQEMLKQAGINCRIESEQVVWWYPWEEEPAIPYVPEKK